MIKSALLKEIDREVRDRKIKLKKINHLKNFRFYEKNKIYIYLIVFRMYFCFIGNTMVNLAIEFSLLILEQKCKYLKMFRIKLYQIY